MAKRANVFSRWSRTAGRSAEPETGLTAEIRSGAQARADAQDDPSLRGLRPQPPLSRLPLVRAGAITAALLALVGGFVVLGLIAGQLRIVVVPLVLALFPAALLAPVVEFLKRRGLPPAWAALLTLLGAIALIAGVVSVLAPQVSGEIPALAESVSEGVDDLQAYIEQQEPFGLTQDTINQRIDELRGQIVESEAIRTGALGAASAAAEMVTMLLLLLVILFFYLRDGGRIAGWVRDLFPQRARADAQEIGQTVWDTVGAYFRGQLTIAVFDAVAIGIGLVLLGVPLALPLAVLVFFGGLFPIVGAVFAGAFAVLVALADGGLPTALITLAIVVGVQQLEGNLLAPMVLGRATELHPLAVLTSLTAGGVLLGVLGAFLAVPVAASLARAVGYLRGQREQVPAPST